MLLSLACFAAQLVIHPAELELGTKRDCLLYLVASEAMSGSDRQGTGLGASWVYPTHIIVDLASRAAGKGSSW